MWKTGVQFDQDKKYADSLLKTHYVTITAWHVYRELLPLVTPTMLRSGVIGKVASSLRRATTRCTLICLAKPPWVPGQKYGATASCPIMSTSSRCRLASADFLAPVAYSGLQVMLLCITLRCVL